MELKIKWDLQEKVIIIVWIVIKNLNNLPDDFTGDLQCNCVVTKKNQDCFEELIDILRKDTPIRGINFTFYVPKKNDTSEFVWKSLKERDYVIKKTIALKEKYSNYILNNKNVLELMLSQHALDITNNCPLLDCYLPLYLGDNGFEIPYCCYGNDVNCDLCGSWGPFHMAMIMKLNPGFPSKLTNDFKKVTPSDILI